MKEKLSKSDENRLRAPSWKRFSNLSKPDDEIDDAINLAPSGTRYAAARRT
jgi:hypothetical protein